MDMFKRSRAGRGASAEVREGLAARRAGRGTGQANFGITDNRSAAWVLEERRMAGETISPSRMAKANVANGHYQDSMSANEYHVDFDRQQHIDSFRSGLQSSSDSRLAENLYNGPSGFTGPVKRATTASDSYFGKLRNMFSKARKNAPDNLNAARRVTRKEWANTKEFLIKGVNGASDFLKSDNKTGQIYNSVANASKSATNFTAAAGAHIMDMAEAVGSDSIMNRMGKNIGMGMAAGAGASVLASAVGIGVDDVDGHGFVRSAFKGGMYGAMAGALHVGSKMAGQYQGTKAKGFMTSYGKMTESWLAGTAVTGAATAAAIAGGIDIRTRARNSNY